MGDAKIPSLNDIKIAGRLGCDPELKYTQANKAYCKFSVCHNRYYKDANGNQVDDPHFFDVTCWDAIAEFIGSRVKKGRPVLVEGQLRQERWQDRDSGQQRSKVGIQASRVHVLDWDNDGQQQGGNGGQRQQQAPQGNGYQQRQAPPQAANGNGYSQRAPQSANGGQGGYQQQQRQAPAPQPRQAEMYGTGHDGRGGNYGPVEEEEIPF